jgi:hypothetical protein
VGGGLEMESTRVLQILRIPALVGLLLAAGTQLGALHRHLTVLETALLWGPWLLMLGCGAAFAVVAVAGRQARHPWAVLLIEVVVAGVLALVPPVLWVLWLRLGWFTRVMGGDTGNAFVQALALVWLVVAVLTVGRQLLRGTTAQRRGATAARDRGR